jgi:hypothetical protein
VRIGCVSGLIPLQGPLGRYPGFTWIFLFTADTSSIPSVLRTRADAWRRRKIGEGGDWHLPCWLIALTGGTGTQRGDTNPRRRVRRDIPVVAGPPGLRWFGAGGGSRERRRMMRGIRNIVRVMGLKVAGYRRATY